MNKTIATDIDTLCINTIRFLSVDTVQQANSGHPGTPMGAAPLAYVLWDRFLKHDPSDPQWPDRDRFILSAGHASALLYSLLHLTGYDLPLEELKRFRQWGSKTPGHPEYGLTPGVEVTTGPLGQGFANGVGMAIAERWLAGHFNRPGHEIIDHYIYTLVSDGDLQEGVASEAASLAGTAQVKEVSLPLGAKSGVVVRTITHTERVSLHPEWLRQRPQEYHHNTRVAFTAGNLIPAQVYYKAQKLRALIRQEVLQVLNDVDVLVQPTSAGPAEVMTPERLVESKEQAKRALAAGSFRSPYSLAGAPALSMLCGFTSEGDGALPLALQIAGRPFDEATVLRIAHAYEQATPWHNRKSPI